MKIPQKKGSLSLYKLYCKNCKNPDLQYLVWQYGQQRYNEGIQAVIEVPIIEVNITKSDKKKRMKI